MATTRKTKPEYDFDAFDEEAEEKAIAELAENAVKYVIVENSFVGKFSDGEIVKVPLNISVETANGLDDVSGNPVDQLRHLLELIGDKESAEMILKQGLVETIVFASKYFGVLAKISKASLPES